MRVIEYLWPLIWRVMTRSNGSSSGYEYLVMLKGLGFESCECHLCIKLIV